MDIAKVVISQYYATLAMLEECVVKCPDNLWTSDDAGNPVFQIAYHALFYTHLYVQPTQADFTPWEKHAEFHSGFGSPSYPGGPAPEAVAPYTKDDMLEYLEICRSEISSIVPILDFEGESGFHWLPFDKLETQFYSIRHTMLHVGEMAERLSASSGVEVDWIGKGPDAA